MEASAILETLINQSPLIAVLGYMLYKIWDAFLKEKDKKDTMAEALIKLTQSWEDRYSKESTDEREIKEFMKEIRELIKDIKNGK